MRKKFTATVKAKIAIEAIKGKKVSEIASLYQVHPTQVQQWKTAALDHLESLFQDKRRKRDKSKDELIEELYKIIGQRETELSWLKKKLSIPDS